MRQIAAFDFDGTLAKGDSLVPFLLRLIGGRRVALAVLRHAPALGLISIGRGNRDLTKEKFIASVLKGHPEREIRELGQSFADDMIRKRMFDDVLAKANWHRSQGHEVVLVSASLDVYLKPLAEKLGFTDAICTRLEILDGRATGKLIGYNNRAEEKVRRFDEWLGNDDNAGVWAYGNSDGDYALLRRSDHPFWVSKSGSLTEWAVTPSS